MARSHPVDDLGQPIKYDPDFNGPLKKRSCTDVICLFIFIVFIACWIGIGIYAFKNGDIDTLLVPKDSSGSRCGLDEHVKDKPYLFFFDLTKCVSPTVAFTGCPTKQVCVKSCPSDYFVWKKDQEPSKLICDYDIYATTVSQGDYYVSNGKCASWYLPSSSLLNRCLYNLADRKSLKMGNIGRIKGDEIAKIKQHLHVLPMWMLLVTQNTIAIFTENEQIQQRCIPTINSTLIQQIEADIGMSSDSITSAIKNLKLLSQAEQVGENIVDDIISSWWRILIGIGLAVLTCIIYIVIMRWIATFMVWLSLIGVLALLTAAVYFTAKKYIDLRNNPVDDDDNDNIIDSYLTKKDTWLVLLIISSIALAIILLILLFLRKRILLAIALVKEGSKAVSSVTSVLFFPIFPWILQIGVIAFAICVALFLWTTGDAVYKIRNMSTACCTGDASSYKNGTVCIPSVFENYCNCDSATVCKFIGMNNPKFYPYLQVYNVFGLFWGVFFVSALGQMILASVFATWYWTFKKSNVPFFAVTHAILRTLRYHIGTLAFGSLIITICRMIRVLLEYVDHKLKKYDNEITKAILCCCKCCFWCLEKFLKFINYNAYIMCAIHGKNFCTSARDAFMLLMRNIVRVFVLDKVTDFLFFLGKLMITVGVGAVAYVVFATDLTDIDNSDLHYDFVPVIIIMICTYLIATIFFNVYSTAVDTLFLCFLEDCERNDGSADKPYFGSRNLMKIFGKKNKMD